MIHRLPTVLLLLAAAAPAWAGDLPGPLIRTVQWDKAVYAPGDQPQAVVTLRNATDAAWTGTVAPSLFNGRGLPQAAPAGQAVEGLAPGAEAALTFAFAAPATPDRGYLAGFAAAAEDGSAADSASGAFDVLTDWSVFPRCGFLSAASAGPGADIAASVAMLASYRVGCIQFYDVNWQHHRPLGPGPTWPNLANITVSRDTLRAGLDAAHANGMAAFDYQLINGAYPGYAADGSGVKPAWGMYTAPCGTACTPAQQDRLGGFPSSWATPGLALMDPGSAAWRSYMVAQSRALLQALPFDGVQLDTLGCPSGRFDASGRPVDQGATLAAWAQAMREGTGKRVILNPVSGCALADVARRAPVDAIYNEIHPEFGDTPYYPSLNGLAASIRAVTTKGAVIPAYVQQQRALNPACHTVTAGAPPCFFSDPGVKLLEAQMLASGLSHWQFGDINGACPVPQAKLISNIYVTGPQLCMSAALQGWMQDAANFAVGYENLLRQGVTDAPEAASLTGAPGSAAGAAGAVYLMPKSKAGMQILHLVNLSTAPSNRLDDPDGAYPEPTRYQELGVTMHYHGTLGSGARLMWASPDVQHGLPQALAYTAGSDAAGGFVSFTLPSLAYWDLVWLETTGLSGDGFGINAFAPVRGVHDASASPGVQSSNYVLGEACCGRWARYEDMQFGNGASSVAVTYLGTAPGRVELRLDGPAGRLVAAGALPRAADYATATLPVRGAAGAHDLFLVFPDRPVVIGSFVFSP